ncbi:hypothetical protein [Actinoalloteichus sp. AHMU CJ021]|uniref:hypothetical protein n=1 Tax=Actinoalloteichus sp. AHMU CJ021 TaxID=2072503 RepID=UPI0026D9F61E
MISSSVVGSSSPATSSVPTPPFMIRVTASASRAAASSTTPSCTEGWPVALSVAMLCAVAFVLAALVLAVTELRQRRHRASPTGGHPEAWRTDPRPGTT